MQGAPCPALGHELGPNGAQPKGRTASIQHQQVTTANSIKARNEYSIPQISARMDCQFGAYTEQFGAGPVVFTRAASDRAIVRTCWAKRLDIWTQSRQNQPFACIAIAAYVIITAEERTSKNYNIWQISSVRKGERYEYKKSFSENYNSPLSRTHNFRNPHGHI